MSGALCSDEWSRQVRYSDLKRTFEQNHMSIGLEWVLDGQLPEAQEQMMAQRKRLVLTESNLSWITGSAPYFTGIVVVAH